jgi:hypothetical protein
VLTGDVGGGEIIGEMEEEREPFEEAQGVGTAEDVEVEPTGAPDRTWLWVGGVAVLLVAIGGGMWAIWKGRKSHG